MLTATNLNAFPGTGDPAYVWARYYLGPCSWSLTPIPRGKKGPILDGWNRPRSESNPDGYISDLELAERVWKSGQNIGVVLGPSHLVSFDLDYVPGVVLALSQIGVDLDALLSGAVRVEGNPSRGKALFRTPDGITLPIRKLAWPPRKQGEKRVTVFELRAGPVQDVLPPSIHPDGHKYRWLNPPGEGGEVTELPGELLHLWQNWQTLHHPMMAACPWLDPDEPSPEASDAAREFVGTSDDLRTEVRRRVPLEPYLRQLGAKHESGKRWLCPFHAESHASFWVFEVPDGTQLWVDGHSGAPVGYESPKGVTVGDVIDIYQHIHKVGFREALGRLADENGIGVGPSAAASAALDMRCAALRATDNDNGERLALRYGEFLRHNKAVGWLVWDGKRWSSDDSIRAAEYAKETARRIYVEPTYIPDNDAAGKRARWAASSNMGKGRREMLEAAKSIPSLMIEVSALDQAPWLLTVENGTVDLRTGILLPHRPSDYITKLAPVRYDPFARCPRVDGFLRRIMNGDEALIAYLWRAIGYSLTGQISERALFFLFGDGANGKSTLINLLRALLGDYGMQTPAETLLAKRTGTIPNDLARLRSARLVATVEVEDGKRLAEAMVKQITGGDAVPARFNFKEWFEYYPEYKVWLAANSKPVIRGTDSAIWERIRLIPFAVTIPKEERDQGLLGKLQEELPGVLARAVQGCLEWQEIDLREPEPVLAATRGYREESDVIQRFVREECILRNDTLVKAGDLRAAYEKWSKDNGEEPLRQKVVADRLKSIGCQSKRGTGGVYWWHGVGLVK